MAVPAGSAAPAPSDPSTHVWPVYQPTVQPKPNCDPQSDVAALAEMDKEAIVELLCSHSSAQRQAIAAAFGDMNDFIRSKFHGDCEDLMLQLVQAPEATDATWIKKAVSGIGTDEELLHEILCTRTNEQIQALCVAYHNRYGEDMADRLRRECSGKHERLVVDLLQAKRATKTMTEADAQQDAQRIWDAGEARLIGVDEAVYLEVFEHRSWRQLHAIVEKFNALGHRDMTTSIKHQFNKAIDLPSTKKFGQCLTTITEFALNPARFWAEKLHQAASGIGTDENTVFRIFVSRSEIELGAVSVEYGQLYGKTLRQMIRDEFSGKVQTALLTLLGSPKKE